MAAEEIINATGDALPEVLLKLGELGIWLQAIGAIAVLWLIFQIANLYVNLKRKKELEKIYRRLGDVEKRIGVFLKKR